MSDAGEFEAFVREYQDMVFATAVRLLGRDGDAEDVAQTVFMRAFERFARSGRAHRGGRLAEDRDDEPVPEPPVTLPRALAVLQRNGHRRSEAAGVDAGWPDGVRAGRSSNGPSGSSGSSGRCGGCPDHQRVPLVLFHFEEMSYQAIAEALRVSLAKVKSDIHRGREALKQELTVPHGSR